MGLIRKLVLSLSFVIIIPVIFMLMHISALNYISTKETQFDNVTSLVENFGKTVSEYIDSSSEKMLSHSLNYALSHALDDPYAIPEAQHEIVRSISQNPYVDNSVLLTTTGDIVFSINPIGDFAPNKAVMDEILKNDGNDIAGETAVDFNFIETGSASVIFIYVPIMANDNSVKGFLVNYFDMRYITSLMKTTLLDGNSGMYIVDSKNNVLSHNGDVTPLSELSITSKRSISTVFQNIGSWGTAETYRFNFDSFTGFQKEAVLLKNKDLNFCVLYVFPSSYLVARISTLIILEICYVAIIAVLIILAYLYFKKSFQGPFEELFRTIQTYESGDWTYRPVIENSNELSLISDALWHMAEKMNYMYLDIKFNEYRYKLSLEFSSDIIYDIDLTKNVVDSAADKWESFFGNRIGTTEKQVFGALTNAVQPEDRQIYEKYRNTLLHDCYDGIEKQCSVEFRVLLNDGNYHWVLKKDILVKGATDNIEHIVGSIVVIDETKNIEIKARVDSLTGLFNRAEFINRLNTLFASENHTEGAVIFFDIDDFKHINDNYGHDVGDDVLKFTGTSILDTIGKNGIGGRYGGDELLAYVYNRESAAGFADAMLDKLSKDFIVRGSLDTLKIKSSIGIAYYPDHETNAEDLIKKADAAMYHAKKNGKNQYRIYTPGDEKTE